MNSTLSHVFDQLITVTAIKFVNGFLIAPERIELDGVSLTCETGRFAADNATYVFKSEGKVFELIPGQHNYDWRLKAIRQAP
ncbi:hypothetical protein EOL73_01575 [Candidatus Saccharibacteria bacterium]|nr:hypothetical protein [Candidatus Saccharibacteria bacterium]NCU40426.1 hypothetical protein [Candidatus Saccharibacteria bacterium]